MMGIGISKVYLFECLVGNLSEQILVQNNNEHNNHFKKEFGYYAYNKGSDKNLARPLNTINSRLIQIKQKSTWSFSFSVRFIFLSFIYTLKRISETRAPPTPMTTEKT